MKKQNVLHLVEYLYLGGIERLLEQLAVNAQDKTNNHFFSYETSELGGIGKQIQESGFPVYTYKKSAGRDWTLVKTLIKTIKENKIDVLHTHDFGPTEYAVILKLRFPSLKLVHTQHTVINFIRHKKYTRFFQAASYFYSDIIAVSQFVADTIHEHCPLMKKNTLKVIANGVDTEIFSPLDNTQLTGALRLVSVARISHEKNIMYLLKTCKFLKESNIPFEFHHAGSAKTQEQIQVLQDFINDHGLSENVTLHGFTNNALSVLKRGSIFVSASHTEGHPVAVLEAMSCKMLCFCSDILAHRELGADIVVLFDKENERALFEMLKVQYLKNGNEETSARLIKGREKVESLFSIQKMVENYVSLYNQ